MALDDIRALALLLGSGLVDARLVTVSDGAVAPETGCRHARRLLDWLGLDIPVAAGPALNLNPPPWRERSKRLHWPRDAESASAPEQACQAQAPARIAAALRNANRPLLLLCLGPLTNVARALEKAPEAATSVRRIIYAGAPPGSESPGWNTERDMEAAARVFAADIPIYCLHLPDRNVPPFDSGLLQKVRKTDSPASQLIASIHDTEAVQGLLESEHLRLWDDLIPLYLAYPSLFRFHEPSPNATHELSHMQTRDLDAKYVRLLRPETDFHLAPRRAVTLASLPLAPKRFRPDLRPYVSRILRRHGREEFKACWLTSELHRHLGTYSLIGAKMGIRAREMLHAPLDGLRVVSRAGSQPPLSCMNDGLQVSTGASLGRGAITVSGGNDPVPSAVFSYQGRKLTLTLKEKWRDRIRSDMRRALRKHGGLNQGYFARVREMSIENWLRLDRREIFRETMERAQ
jgi:pyrimidine-specific ribonucleoside hydrolase